MSSYPVPSCAVPVSAGMMIAVPAELLASPLKNGRGLGEADRSALVIGGTEKIRTGGPVVFCKVVAVAGAQVRRDGQVRAKGSPVHHARLGPLEESTGPDAVSAVAGRVLDVSWGSPECRVTLHQVPLGKLLQHISAGVVFVVAAGLTPVVPGDRRSRNTCGETSRILMVADLDVP